MRRSTSRNKLLLTITVILIFSFVGVSGLNYMITRASVSEEILQNDLPLTMDNIYSELTSEMMRPLLLSSLMASDTFLKNWVLEGEQDTENVIDYLNEIKEKYGFFTTFFVSAETNIYYRFGGIEDSGVLAERIRQTVEFAPLLGEENGLDELINPVTLSCGVTVFRQGDDMDSMLLRADRGLYRCKKKGGNCVEVDDA